MATTLPVAISVARQTVAEPPLAMHAWNSYCASTSLRVASWMIAGLGVDIAPLIPVAVERDGHVRVGLEDMPFGCAARNVELVRAAVGTIAAAGGRVARAAEIRVAMDPGSSPG